MSASHDHSHDHHHDTTQMSDARLVWAVAVNLLLTVAQIIGGVISGSLSLVADALHNLNDAASLGVALIARRIARRPADKTRTFGYRRAEVIGALINTTTLILVGLYLIYEAVMRFFQPEPIAGWIVVIVAGIALVVDVITAMLTLAEARHSTNIKAAFMHNLADALGSVVVMGVGAVVLTLGWKVVDPIATLGLAGYILYMAWPMMRDSIHILMDGVPEGVSYDAMVEMMTQVAGVVNVHHVHVRHLDEQHTAVEAHVVMDRRDWAELERIKGEIKHRLHEQFGVEHTTLEFEWELHSHEESDHDRGVVPRH